MKNIIDASYLILRIVLAIFFALPVGGLLMIFDFFNKDGIFDKITEDLETLTKYLMMADKND